MPRRTIRPNGYDIVAFSRGEIRPRQGDIKGLPGASGTAYQRDRQGLVLKQYRDPAYDAFLDVAQSSGSKHFPLGSQVVDAQNGKRQILLEPLEPLATREDQIVLGEMQAYYAGKSSGEALPQSLRDALDLLRSGKRPLRDKIDLSRNNVMKRSDGTIVITDPYASRQLGLQATAAGVAVGVPAGAAYLANRTARPE